MNNLLIFFIGWTTTAVLSFSLAQNCRYSREAILSDVIYA